MKRVHVTIALTIDVKDGDVDGVNGVSHVVNRVLDNGDFQDAINAYSAGNGVVAERRVRAAAITAVYAGAGARPVTPRKRAKARAA